MMVNIGDYAPGFSLPQAGGILVSLKDLLTQKGGIILYFYPKDDTSGCTQQACEFSMMLPDFTQYGFTVVGISKDPPASHQKFQAKYNLNILLLSDLTTEVCQSYGVWAEKSLYGRKYFGIERTTFLIDKAGIIQQIWRKVKVKDHSKIVLEALKRFADTQ